jgi:hypothetical protein
MYVWSDSSMFPRTTRHAKIGNCIAWVADLNPKAGGRTSFADLRITS